MNGVEKGFNHIVVSHLIAPEHLFAQLTFPVTGYVIAAFDIVIGDDLVPPVLGIAEDHRPRFLQGIVISPEFFALLHNRPVRDFRNILSQF